VLPRLWEKSTPDPHARPPPLHACCCHRRRPAACCPTRRADAPTPPPPPGLVQEALHATRAPRPAGWTWAPCSDPVWYGWPGKDEYANKVPAIKELLPSLKILVFSGDQDDVCPTQGTRAWIDRVKLPVASPWAAFRSWNGQVSGRVACPLGASRREGARRRGARRMPWAGDRCAAEAPSPWARRSSPRHVRLALWRAPFAGGRVAHRL
jgi:hypothetical protein